MIGNPPATLGTPTTLRHLTVRPAPPAMGSWRYQASQRSQRILWLAMLCSAGFHVVVLFGFNRHARVVHQAVVDDAIPVMLAMPDLKDLEDQEPQPSDSDKPVDAGLTVPTLADVPTQVDLSTAFVQQIDYSTLVPQQDLNAAKTLTIPTHINHGGKIGEGMGKIFDLKDLDHQPEPLVRIAPVFPANAKVAGMRADVTVGFIVDANGVVVNAYVVSSTDRRFDDSAIMAISKWKFRPGIKNGHHVNVRMAQPFPFVLKALDE